MMTPDVGDQILLRIKIGFTFFALICCCGIFFFSGCGTLFGTIAEVRDQTLNGNNKEFNEQ
jgi:hypothetical protein